jgi:hypothetical protein
MTTAEKTSADFLEAATLLSEELSIPLEVMLRKNMMKILSEGLIPRMA